MSKKRHAAPSVRALSMRYPDGFVLDAHEHPWSQLLYASSGVMRVESRASVWIVPSSRAVWLPARTSHAITMSGSVAMRTIYFPPRARVPLGETCVIEVSPLLRELLVHAAARGKLDRAVAHDDRVAGLIVDLLRGAGPAHLELPIPRDPRAAKVAAAVRARPAAGSLAQLARRAGASPRTIERLFATETGLGFGRWRQQARLLEALTLLAGGASVTAVADAVGYASASAFVVMFRAALGTTPGRYFGS